LASFQETMLLPTKAVTKTSEFTDDSILSAYSAMQTNKTHE
jgi:hypothetical protein